MSNTTLLTSSIDKLFNDHTHLIDKMNIILLKYQKPKTYNKLLPSINQDIINHPQLKPTPKHDRYVDTSNISHVLHNAINLRRKHMTGDY